MLDRAQEQSQVSYKEQQQLLLGVAILLLLL